MSPDPRHVKDIIEELGLEGATSPGRTIDGGAIRQSLGSKPRRHAFSDWRDACPQWTHEILVFSLFFLRHTLLKTPEKRTHVTSNLTLVRAAPVQLTRGQVPG